MFPSSSSPIFRSSVKTSFESCDLIKVDKEVEAMEAWSLLGSRLIWELTDFVPVIEDFEVSKGSDFGSGCTHLHTLTTMSDGVYVSDPDELPSSTGRINSGG